MATRNSIRVRRARRRVQKKFELQLTSLMDVMVIIVVFLLKSYATSTNTFTTVPGMKIPISSSQDMPPDSLQVIVTPEAITFEGERVLEFQKLPGDAGSTEDGYSFKPTDLSEGNRQIRPLFDALVKARDKAELLRAKSKARDAQGNPLPFDGILAVTADKRVQYDTIRKIMYTAATAGYKVFRFLALKKET
jgi:biopolymer transport protein ExbD